MSEIRENTKDLQFLAADNFDLTRKIAKKIWSKKIRENAMVLHFLAVNNCSLTRKIAKNNCPKKS